MRKVSRWRSSSDRSSSRLPSQHSSMQMHFVKLIHSLVASCSPILTNWNNLFESVSRYCIWRAIKLFFQIVLVHKIWPSSISVYVVNIAINEDLWIDIQITWPSHLNWDCIRNASMLPILHLEKRSKFKIMFRSVYSQIEWTQLL